MFLGRHAEAEIGHQTPACRHIEHARDRDGIQDRDPAHADAIGAGGEPQRLDRSHHRVVQRFRHGLLAEAAAGVGAVVGEHREMDRRLLQPGELQSGIDRLLLAGVAAKRLLVGLGEARHDRRAPLRRDDMHEPPGLAKADRGRVTRDLEQRIDTRRLDGIGSEAPYVAPPQDEIAELAAECRVEGRGHVCFLSMA